MCYTVRGFALTQVTSSNQQTLGVIQSLRYMTSTLHMALLCNWCGGKLFQSTGETSNCVWHHLDANRTKTLLMNSCNLCENLGKHNAGLRSPVSLKDVKLSKAKTWTACNRLTKLWKSSIGRDTKFTFFKTLQRASDRSDQRHVTRNFEDQINEFYTQHMRRVLDIMQMTGPYDQWPTVWWPTTIVDCDEETTAI